MHLIDFINITYLDTGKLASKRNSTTLTTLHICCNHFMKMTTKDINVHFPVNQSSNVVRVFIKEAMALMFNLSDILLIETLYRDLSIILNSKYLTDEVISTIKNITLMAKDTDDVNGHRNDTSNATNVDPTAPNVDENNADQSAETVQNENILEYDEDEDDVMYKQSNINGSRH